MVPDGWKASALADFCSKPISYGIVQTGEDVPDGVPCLRVVDLTKKVMNPREMIKTTREISDSYKKTILEEGEIVMALRGEVGLCKIIDRSLVQANITRGLARISAKKEIVSPNYLVWELRSPRFRSDLIRRVGGSALQEISLGELRMVETLIPPLPEQKKIAEILSTWDEAIAANEDLLANSRLRKKALMQKLLTGKTRLPGFGGEWIQRPLGSLLVEVKRPVAWSDDSYYRLLSVKRRSGGVVLREVLHGTKILTKKMNVARTGDYLISKMQVVHGASGAVPSRFDGHHISDSYIALTAKLVDVLDMGFFSWYGKQKIMYHKALLSSYGVHIEKMTFSLNDFMKQKITIPPCVKEQKSIAAVLSAAEEEIEALEQRIDNLKTQKKALMQQLLTGKKRVKVDQIAA